MVSAPGFGMSQKRGRARFLHNFAFGYVWSTLCGVNT